MIEFHSLPANEAATDEMVKNMASLGYEGEEAQRLVDAAASITLCILRGLDEKIIGSASDPTDRTVIQQLIFHQLIGIGQLTMETNATRQLYNMLFGRGR